VGSGASTPFVPTPTDLIVAAFSALLAGGGPSPVVVWEDRRITPADLDDLAVACARLLAKGGAEPGAVVALTAANAAGFLAALIALRRAGCAALLLDGASPAGEKLRIARSMGALGILECLGSWPESPGGGFRFTLSELEPADLQSVGRDVAVIKLTSGSTGRPRGILTPSEALVADEAALAATMGLGAGERILAAVPLTHSYGLSSIALPALLRGATVVVPAGDSPVSTLLTAERQGATFLPSVPAYLAAVIGLAAPPPLPATLRRIVSAGAPLAPSTAQRFRELLGQPIHVFYGSSECGGICYDREGVAGELGSVGTPVEGARVTLETVGPGHEQDSGSVTVESAAVAQSYFPEPEPRLENGRFRTLDLGRWKEGRLHLAGRIDDLINVRGKNVNPREIEAVIAQLPGVEDVAALGVPAAEGRGEVLRAVVACAPGRLDVATLRAWCRRHLADYKVPRSLVLVERLPRTERGKLDRAALRALSGWRQRASVDDD
jgi:acyl-CoA synthetase (AMP-forming)/AMP-acid ligase II